jgi:hypothetical protein
MFRNLLETITQWIRDFLGVSEDYLLLLKRLEVMSKQLRDMKKRLDILEGRGGEVQISDTGSFTALASQVYHDRNRARAEGLIAQASRVAQTDGEYTYVGGHVEYRNWLTHGDTVLARFTLDELETYLRTGSK